MRAWGDWQDLDTADQTRRYETIARLLADLHADRAVLDVGCGTALLKRFLPPTCLYVGVEQSADAIALAVGAVVFHIGAEALPPVHIDTVVFNEVLYYCPDPVHVFQSLSQHARVVLCSIYQAPPRPSLRRRLTHLLHPRTPLSNRHCEIQIRAAMASDWRLVHDLDLPPWHIWSAIRHGIATERVELA